MTHIGSKMKALRFDRFGNPDVLRIAEIEKPRSDGALAVIAVRAASINPSDVGNVAGRFPATTLPRTPGRDYSGVVVDGPKEWMGVEVWGSGDGGFKRDGSHAEFIAVPVASLRRKPSMLSHEQASSVGVIFSAAWLGVVEYAKLKQGETLVVVGATGGVGGAAVQIGRRIGARVIGIARTAPEPRSSSARGADQIVTPKATEAAALIRKLTDGRGADVVLNAVGGPTFEPALEMLAHRGRMSVLASPAQRRQSFDLLDFYHNESQLFGVDTLARDMVGAAEVHEALTPGFEDGTFLPPEISETVSLDRAAAAYRAVAGGSLGRIVLVPQLV